MTHSPTQSTRSMTGFASSEGELNGKRIRLEIKALNHRFLDIKLRLSREHSSLELHLRNLLQNAFSRGAIEVKIEKVSDAGDISTEFQTNLSVAAHYFESLIALPKTLG